jgi:hypothetical protein
VRLRRPERRAEFCSNKWDGLDRPELERKLAEILPSSARRPEFIDRALTAIAEHRQLILPSLLEDRIERDQLDRVARLGREFGRALLTLPPGARDLLCHQIGKGRPPGTLWPASVEISDRGEAAVFIADQGEAAKETARAARELLGRKPRTGRPNSTSIPLIAPLARVWAGCFGERPAMSAGGTFARAVRELLEAANLDAVTGRGIIAVLRDVDFTAPRPPRGPRN